MLRPVMIRLPTRRKPFPRLASSLSSSCATPLSPRITQSVTRQRRDSSSKPSSSAPPSGGDANPVSATAEAPTTRKRGSFSKAGSRLKSKDTAAVGTSPNPVTSERKEEAFAIPSVPSTQHLHLQDVHLASLFAFHRPISVHHTLPQSISNKRFGQIFAQKPSPPKHQHGEVISTISDTLSNIVKEIEKNPDHRGASRVIISDSEANAKTFDKNQKDPNYVTPEGTPVFVDIDAMVRNLPPYVPPPPPKQPSTRKTRARVSKTARMDEFFTPSAVEMVEMPEEEQISVQRIPIQPFLDRMRVRQMGYLERIRETMYAISVRRQRKLKMKKHKYKKLMKRTRNLRRRQDRL